MAPLVPDIIGNEFNLVIALLIGIAFGYILEQAGFSTSKKLVGLFYGYDFTVLRVFFTAGITAMMGVVAFSHFGLLDTNIIYINPTFLWSAIVGGLIMGLGFVTGGFCPGTSVCAAAIGKIDAMIFIAGSVFGVFIFAEGYPYLENFYKAESWGNIRVFESLGTSQGFFAFLMVFAAVAAFIVTTLIENKVNGKPNPEFNRVKLYSALACFAILIGLSAFIMPERQQYISEKSEIPGLISKTQIRKISSDELAYRIINDINSFHIFDLRAKEEYNRINLPNSENIQDDYFFSKDASKKINKNNIINVLIAATEPEEIKANFIASETGYDEMFILEGGWNGFSDTILNFRLPAKIETRWEKDTYKFRENARVMIPELIERNKKQNPGDTKKTKRIIGGC